jgi:DNA-binding LacI/PurR family transcriptional regulator
MTGNTGIDSGISLYSTLAERLRRSIREHEYLPGQLIGSEHDLARTQGLSRVTVRKASELLVNEGLIERRPGKGLYVRANFAATQLVQVIVGNLRWEPCLQVAIGVKEASKDAHVQVQLYDAHRDAEMDLNLIRQLPDGPIQGAVIVSFYSPALNKELYALESKGFPFVLVDQRLRDIEVPSVISNNLSGGYQAGKALLAQGHKRIGFIGDLIAGTVQDRLAGLRDAVGDANLPFDRSLVVDLEDQDRLGDWSVRIEECVRDIMGRANPPTALFCSCDAVARSAYRVLAAMGLNIPGDISVVGFDDDPLAEWVSPAMATVRQDFKGMGKAAIDLLCKRMADPSGPIEHRVMPVQWVERGSVARPRNLSND